MRYAKAQERFSEFPKVSIVTPSYNQGHFIEETIRSVIDQRYPNLEYFILDGGSTDNTRDVIRKYEDNISGWVSKPDGGAAEAIESGRQRCTGELFNWLNSDDFLVPRTLLSLGTIATKYPEYDVYAFCGLATWVNGPLVALHSRWPKMHFHLLSCESAFAQESTFVRSSFLRQASIQVRKEYQNWFDVSFYMEMLASGARVLFINAYGGVIRHQPASKTAFGTPPRDYQELNAWIKATFNWRQRLWRRLSQTRLRSFLIALSNKALTRAFIAIALGWSLKYFTVCEFIGGDCTSPSSWVIRR